MKSFVFIVVGNFIIRLGTGRVARFNSRTIRNTGLDRRLIDITAWDKRPSNFKSQAVCEPSPGQPRELRLRRCLRGVACFTFLIDRLNHSFLRFVSAQRSGASSGIAAIFSKVNSKGASGIPPS